MDRWRVAANLATLGNATLGVGAILYTLAGNPLWAMLLIVSGIAFDGLDGIFSRRSLNPGHPLFGRVADSIADAITFGLAPATLIIVHTANHSQWNGWITWAFVVGVAYVALALARLVYFTARGFQRNDFLGVPTPQSALTVVILTLAFDVPAFLGILPSAFLLGAAAVGALMIVPVPVPKIRQHSRLRPAMIVTGVAIAIALVPLQFRPAFDSPLYYAAAAAAAVAAGGVLSYYLWGPSVASVTPAPPSHA
jgi:phosphatidylserine synthase